MGPTRELTDLVTNTLLGKPYVLKGSEQNMNSFSCWSCVWHYERICGLALPYDPFEAASQFVRIDTIPQWRDILSHKNGLSPVPHLGVVEAPGYVLHCNNLDAGVVRDEHYFPPWETASVWRHVTLL